MASVYGMVRSLVGTMPTYPALRSMLGRKAQPAIPLRPAYADMVENEVIPRLLLAHAHERVAVQPCGKAIAADEIAAFGERALTDDAGALLDTVEALLARGISVDTILIDLLAPAARHLGTMWEDDTTDFVAVTMALWRLQEIVRELSARVPASGDTPHRRALFVTMPGEQHSFGTVIVEDIFRRGGWQTEVLTNATRQDLIAMVAEREFDLIGITVGIDRFAADVAQLVSGLRAVSANPALGVLLGGPAFSKDSAKAVKFGADAPACDAKTALAVASALVDGRVAQDRLPA
ncbi:MAG: B12-binding domain-containing protein [Sphingomonadaceae bacterium]